MYIGNRSGSDLNLSVEIYETVIERIRKVVSKSSIEEGGKFLGRLNKIRNNKLLIRVETYIDSGPHVDNSRGHLQPDGNYQEAIFRVLEMYDPEIEHLGTWHTHHCNGLEELSSGDISGYFETVNHPDYNLDYFFALLVTNSQMDMRCYLFTRGQRYNEYIELDSEVKIIQATSPIEPFLQTAEQLSFKHRPRLLKNFLFGFAKKQPTNKINSLQNIDLIQEIRLEDQKSLLEIYPEAKLLRKKKSGVVYWEWSEKSKYGKLDIRYEYPTSADSGSAQLKISCGYESVLKKEISLDDSRFDKIREYIAEAKVLLVDKTDTL